jgi:hypothetical protein
MTVTIRVRIDAPAGTPPQDTLLDLPTERVTLRALVKEQVLRELAEMRRSGKAGKIGLRAMPRVAPAAAATDAAPEIDETTEIATAIDAFRRGRILALVGERHVTDLDEPIEVTFSTTVRFVRLVPLVGG